MPDRHRRRLAAVAALAGLLAAGCATLPTSGSVQVGKAFRQADNSVGLLPPGLPTAGMTQNQILGGFLSAQLTPSGGGIARAYLTAAERARWRLRPGITVYDDRVERWRSTGNGRWVLQTRQIALIDPSGHWIPSPGPLALHFRLVRVGGQWRIATPPDHQVLASGELAAAYSEYDLAFLSPGAGHEVDVPVVLLDQQPGLANALVQSLLAGPPRELAGAVSTAAPKGARLIGNVPIANGTAAVNLTEPVRALPSARLRTFAEQVLVTLRQIAGVHAVRLLADRTTLLTVTSAGNLQPPAGRQPALTLVRPDGRTVLARVGGTQDNRSTTLPRWEPLLGRRWPAVTQVAPTEGAHAVAVTSGRRAQQLLAGADLGRPRVIARAGSVSLQPVANGRLLAILDGRRVAAVAGHRLHAFPRWLSGNGLRALAVAPNGVQAAVVTGGGVGGRLLVGALRPDGRLVGLQPILGVTGVIGVGWAVDGSLLAVGRLHGRRSLVTTDPVGFDLHRSGLPPGGDLPSKLCAAPLGPPVVITDGVGWRLDGGRWLRLGPATDCAYTG